MRFEEKEEDTMVDMAVNMMIIDVIVVDEVNGEEIGRGEKG